MPPILAKFYCKAVSCVVQPLIKAMFGMFSAGVYVRPVAWYRGNGMRGKEEGMGGDDETGEKVIPTPGTKIGGALADQGGLSSLLQACSLPDSMQPVT